jgi:hypothetical protein
MKIALLILLASCLSALVGCACCPTGDSCCADGAGPYRHVVLFKFKADATPQQVQAVETAFAKLPSKIDSIRAYEWGTDVSPEGKAEGFTHCFLVTFADKAGLENYLPHPAHQDFVKVLRPILDKVLVVDYVARR